MTKRKRIIIISAALCLAALCAACCIAALRPDVSAEGVKLNAKLKGLETGSLKLTLSGEFPKDCSLNASIPQIFVSFTDNGSKLLAEYSDLVNLTQLEAEENRAVFNIAANTSGEGRLVFDFSNKQGRQSRAVVYLKTDEELNFTEALIYFDEEPEETTAVLGEIYEARIKRTDEGIELRIPAPFQAFSAEYYDASVIGSVEISYEADALPDNGADDAAVGGTDADSESGDPAGDGSPDSIAYTEYSAAVFNAAQEKNSGKTDDYADSGSCTAVISVQAFAEGCGNLVLRNGRDGKLLTLDLQVSECSHAAGDAPDFKIEILDSWCEDFDYNYD